MRMLSAAAALAACTSLAAQTPSTGAKPDAPGRTVTVTGCLRAGAEPGTFVLERVTWAPSRDVPKDTASHHADAPERTPPAAAAPAASDRPAPPPGDTLRLAGVPDPSKLSAHVGHTETATGMVGPTDPPVRPAIVVPDAPAKDAQAGRGRGEAPAPRVLNARSVTHVADACK